MKYHVIVRKALKYVKMQIVDKACHQNWILCVAYVVHNNWLYFRYNKVQNVWYECKILMWHPVVLFSNLAHRVGISLNTTEFYFINRTTSFGLGYTILRFTNDILVNKIQYHLDWYQFRVLNVRFAYTMRCIGKGRRLDRPFV
jgi:hypothetical protein